MPRNPIMMADHVRDGYDGFAVVSADFGMLFFHRSNLHMLKLFIRLYGDIYIAFAQARRDLHPILET